MSVSITLNDDRSEKIRYNYPGYPVYMREALLSQYPEYRAPSHWHDDIEFICVLSGGMKYNINGEIVNLKKGEGIFVNSGQMHSGFSDNGQECGFLCLLFHPMLLCSVFPYENDFVTPLIQNSRTPYLLLCPEQAPAAAWQQEILSRLCLLYRNRNSHTAPLRALSSFAMIWSLLLEHAPADSVKGKRQSQDLTIVKNMTGFIQKNYREKISLAEIASSGAVGQSKCCRLFARYFSQSPNEYLNHYRLSKSLDLLHNTDMSVTEIALSVGFGGASYFAETFRKRMGVSPTEFRRRDQ